MFKLKKSTSLDMRDVDKVDFLESIKKNGFDCVDITYGYMCTWNESKQQEELKKNKKRLKILSDYGININAVHASFGPLWCLSDNVEKNRENAIKRHINLAKMFEETECKIMNLHLNGWDFKKERNREEGILLARDSLVKIGNSTSLKIAAENLPRNCLGNTATELMKIIDGINNVYTVCDVNHFLQETAESGIMKMGKTIVDLHISDFDGVDEKHWLPKKGVNDWNAIFDALDKINYNGAFTYELDVFSPNDFKILSDNYNELLRDYEYHKKMR